MIQPHFHPAVVEEPLGFSPDHLVKEIAAFVSVVVFGNYPATTTRFLFAPEATCHECGDYHTLVATRVAVNQHFAVSIPEAERWVFVIVRWAASQPTGTRLSRVEVPSDFSSIHSFQLTENGKGAAGWTAPLVNGDL